MNTTTLVLTFKHRYIPIRWNNETPPEVLEYAGWQHMYSDKTRDTVDESPWMEVETFYGDTSVPPVLTKPLFPCA